MPRGVPEIEAASALLLRETRAAAGNDRRAAHLRRRPARRLPLPQQPLALLRLRRLPKHRLLLLLLLLRLLPLERLLRVLVLQELLVELVLEAQKVLRREQAQALH